MGREVSIEIHVRQRGRWEIHARYNGESKREAAIEEARTIDMMPNVEAVKVVREVYNTEEGVANEYTIYKSPGSGARSAPAKPASARPIRRGPSPPSAVSSPDFSEFDDFDSEEDEEPRKKSGLGAFFGRLLLVTLFSFAVSALIAGVAGVYLKNIYVFGIPMVGRNRDNTLFGLFVLSFLGSAIPMAMKFLSVKDINLSLGGRKNIQPEKVKIPASSSKVEIPPLDPLPDLEAESESEIDRKLAELDRLEAQEQEKDEEGGAARPEARKPAAEEGSEAPENKVGEAPLSAYAEKQKTEMVEFIKNALQKAQAVHKKLDNYNKFGINLFIAGACEAMTDERKVLGPDRVRILRDCVMMIGFKKPHAESFARKYEDYLLQDSRYMQMFQLGRNTMNNYLGGEAGEVDKLTEALTDWNKPKPKEDKTGPVTVMFTDMVGSTALTQSRGDAVAQQVVRVHNRIVRNALADFAGKEIKHTGDGIMASFPTTSNGVEAAIAIQKGVLAHNRSNPDLPLQLKVGINAGEPIAEDDDLFGTTVQLAARIVDKAKAGQIFVSEIVRGICAGKQILFVSLGGHELKGFGDKLTLYEVVWQDASAAVPPPTPPASAPVASAAPSPAPAPGPTAPAPTPGGPAPAPVAQPSQPDAAAPAKPGVAPVATAPVKPVVVPAAAAPAKPAAATTTPGGQKTAPATPARPAAPPPSAPPLPQKTPTAAPKPAAPPPQRPAPQQARPATTAKPPTAPAPPARPQAGSEKKA